MTLACKLSRNDCIYLHLALHITELRCRHLVVTTGALSHNIKFRTSMTNATPEMFGSYTFFRYPNFLPILRTMNQQTIVSHDPSFVLLRII